MNNTKQVINLDDEKYESIIWTLYQIPFISLLGIPNDIVPDEIYLATNAWTLSLLIPKEVTEQIYTNALNYLEQHYFGIFDLYYFDTNLRKYINKKYLKGTHTFDYLFKESPNYTDNNVFSHHLCSLLDYPMNFQNYYEYLELMECNSEQGYIYLIENNGLYKIGRTTQPDKRLNTYYKTENPRPYTLIYKRKVYFHVFLEKKLHNFFKSKQNNREWFNLDLKDLQNINQILDLWECQS